VATVFSHSLVGAALAPLAPRQIPKVPLLLALIALPAIPDLDVIAFSFGIPYAHPLGHRGFSHSLLAGLLMGYATAFLFVRWCRPFRLQWWGLGLLLGLASASHGVLDAFTDAGHGVAFFWPFDNSRYFFPFRPLPTSPIGIPAFFNGEAWPILASELRWIWLPTSAIWLLLQWLRSRGVSDPADARK